MARVGTILKDPQTICSYMMTCSKAEWLNCVPMSDFGSLRVATPTQNEVIISHRDSVVSLSFPKNQYVNALDKRVGHKNFVAILGGTFKILPTRRFPWRNLRSKNKPEGLPLPCIFFPLISNKLNFFFPCWAATNSAILPSHLPRKSWALSLCDDESLS